MFGDIRRRLKTLETQAVSEINRVEKEDSDNVSEHIQQTRLRKMRLSSRMDYIQELCNMVDPLAVLRGIKRAPFLPYSTGDDCTPNDVDEALSSVILHIHFKGLNSLLADVRLKHGLYLQEAMDILLDVNTASNDVAISKDRKAASYVNKEIPRPNRPERFQCLQVMSNKGVSSGQHYWEVETSAEHWVVGLAYPTMDRRQRDSMPTIGYNNKSWGFDYIDGYNGANHNGEYKSLGHSLQIEKMGIFLDYEAGRMSFYKMGDPIRHLHTFTPIYEVRSHESPAAQRKWKMNAFFREHRTPSTDVQSALRPLAVCVCDLETSDPAHVRPT
uniref:B30.2/SPRY domain-containing protein n=1 Tax=Leptobrachium leishanense TaxID=445787 RepID=A0A8C5PVG8_9ANUR